MIYTGFCQVHIVREGKTDIETFPVTGFDTEGDTGRALQAILSLVQMQLPEAQGWHKHLVSISPITDEFLEKELPLYTMRKLHKQATARRISPGEAATEGDLS